MSGSTSCRRVLLLVGVWVLSCCAAAALRAATILENANVDGLLEVTNGEWVELRQTLTLDKGTINVVDGLLQTASTPVHVVGEGNIYLRQFNGGWSNKGSFHSLNLGSGVAVYGEPSTVLYTPGTMTNNGLIASLPGTSSNPFQVRSQHFVNHGLLEASSQTQLLLRVSGNPLQNDGIFRVQQEGILSLLRESFHNHVYLIEDLGTIENLGGTVRLGLSINNAGKTLNLTGGDWQLNPSGQILGGEITTSAGGTFGIGPSSGGTVNARLSGVTLNTDLRSVYGSRVALANDVTLNGTWNLGWHIEFDGDETLRGNGTIVTDGEHGWLQSYGEVVIEEGITLASRNDGRLRLLAGDTDTSYTLHGLTEADGGIVELGNLVHVDNHGEMVARNGGRLQFINSSSPSAQISITNHPGAEIRVESGAEIYFSADIENHGSLTIDGGNLLIRDYDVTGDGSVSITNSLILAAGTTLGELMSVPGTNNEYGTYSGQLNLAGETLELADQPGKRWTLRGGTLSGGTVTSLDGQELQTASSLGGANSETNLSNLQLDADLRIVAGTSARVYPDVTGTGNFIVDGGRLYVGNLHGGTFVHAAINRVVPLDGEVVLSGAIDNVGQTLHLPAGVDWLGQHSRSNFIVGGRIEGDPGVELRMIGGYGAVGYATFHEGVTLALPLVVDNTSIFVREGLTLDDTTITIGVPNGNALADARVTFVDSQTLDGLGEVHFSNIDGFPSHPELPRINMIEVQQGATLTIGEGISIRTESGSGYIGGRYFYQLPPEKARLVNHGAIVAENGHTLTMFTEQFDQQGILRSASEAKLIVHDVSLSNAGRLELAGGTMHFTGDLTQTATAALSFEFSAALVDADFAAVDVAGELVLGGALEATFVDDETPYTPAVGDRFSLLAAAGGVSGDFSTMSLPALSVGLYWHIDRGAESVALTILDGGPEGDFDFDGDVDGRDLLAWQRNPRLGSLADWQNAYGSDSLSAATAVPEPGWMALLLGFVLLSGRVRIVLS